MTAMTASAPGEEPEEHLDEVEEILQTPHPIEIRGIECDLARLRTREFLVMTRILSEGLGGRLALMAFGEEEDEEVLAGKLAGILVSAIPYAGDEVIQFIRVMVKPRTDDPKEFEMVRQELENPELDVLTSVITAIVEQEAGNLVGLGKAFRTWWSTANLGEKFKRSGTGS